MNTSPKIDIPKVNEVFGERVKAARLKKGWLQADLAQAMGEVLGKSVNTSTINRIENNARPTPLHEVYALSEALRVSVHDLVPPEDGLMTAALPLFNAANETAESITKMESEIVRLKARDRKLMKSILGYWTLRRIANRPPETVPESIFREDVALLYDGIAAEGEKSHGVMIAEAVGLPSEQCRAVMVEGDNENGDTKGLLINLLVEHFQEQLDASS